MLQQTNWPPHITVATIVKQADRYLMVEEIDGGTAVINQPAGHLEPGESLFEAALRETLEETRWKVELTGLVGFYQYQAPATLYYRFAFTARAIEETEAAIDPDITAVHWLNRDEILARPHRSPMVLRCIDDADRKILPLDAIHDLTGIQS